MKKVALYILAIISIIKITVLTTGCANIVPPTGGPRDSLPPVLIKTVPPDSARNFSGKKITFTFDEYVDVQDVQANLMVSPVPKINPVVERKLHTVTVKLRDTLEANTTYAINFGNAIRDVHEANVLKNFTYVFSTGNTIDSNTLSGRVLLAETGKADSTLIVVLHTSPEDSAVVNKRPRYYTRLDSSGNFHFRFLAPGAYHIYAMKDESGTKRYMSKTQLFAFADKPVMVAGGEPSVLLYAYNSKEEEKKPAAPAAVTSWPKKEEDRRLKYQANLQGDQLDLLGDFILTFNDPLKTFDTSKVVLTDEKFNRLGGYTISADSSNRIYTLKYPWQAATTYQLILDKEFASDSADRKLLKTDTLLIKAKSEAEYGSVRLRFTNLDTANRPVLQLVQGGSVAFSRLLTGKELYVKLFKPGDYEIRVLYDANNNGVWDTGDFFGKHLQPERVLSINKKLTVRADWDNEVTVE
ncbi:MAG TPA: Ig-like domain-containing domain [Chitinophagaceae bacterium]|nr:Ig-like domain-containing domain [Chitinophagaceae bacterium]